MLSMHAVVVFKYDAMCGGGGGGEAAWFFRTPATENKFVVVPQSIILLKLNFTVTNCNNFESCKASVES